MNIYRAMFGSLANVLDSEEFKKKKKLTTDAAFDKIFAESESGQLIWQRTEESLRSGDIVATVVRILNSAGEEIPVNVYLHSKSEREDVYYYGLSIGEKDGPTRDISDPRVKKLVKDIFGVTVG